MVIKEKLVRSLMDNLMCICISANGGAPYDKNGELAMTEQMFEATEEYARKKFMEIMSEWEELFEEKWFIECDEMDECEED